ncbi:hypothetical protein PINS_up004199 [Pythium insidiosum]|nr:hypothetical protein PINS_up004199 [Pythium insidiosum]
MEDVHVPPSTRTLQLANTPIQEIRFHAGIPNVKQLDLEGALVSSIEDVSLPPSLEELVLYGSKIDAVVFHSGLKNLKTLYMTGSPTTKFEVRTQSLVLETIFVTAPSIGVVKLPDCVKTASIVVHDPLGRDDFKAPLHLEDLYTTADISFLQHAEFSPNIRKISAFTGPRIDGIKFPPSLEQLGIGPFEWYALVVTCCVMSESDFQLFKKLDTRIQFKIGVSDCDADLRNTSRIELIEDVIPMEVLVLNDDAYWKRFSRPVRTNHPIAIPVSTTPALTSVTFVPTTTSPLVTATPSLEVSPTIPPTSGPHTPFVPTTRSPPLTDAPPTQAPSTPTPSSTLRSHEPGSEVTTTPPSNDAPVKESFQPMLPPVTMPTPVPISTPAPRSEEPPLLTVTTLTPSPSTARSVWSLEPPALTGAISTQVPATALETETTPSNPPSTPQDNTADMDVDTATQVITVAFVDSRVRDPRPVDVKSLKCQSHSDISSTTRIDFRCQRVVTVSTNRRHSSYLDRRAPLSLALEWPLEVVETVVC